jgi:hypothetical protein
MILTTSPGDNPELSEDEALSRFLSREPAPQKPKKSKKSRTPLILILAILLVAVLIAAIILLNHQPAPEDSADETAGAEITASLNADKEHIVTVPIGDDGAPVQNGAGELLCYETSDVREVTVTNADGSFTLTSDSSDDETVYTLVGYEGYPLESGSPEAVIGSVAELPFLSIASVGGEPADFGLDTPRATVRAAFADDTFAAILIGDEAPASAGVYAALGDASAVFLVSADAVDPFLYQITDLISLSVTDAPADEDTAFTKLTISGTNFADPIVLEPGDTDSGASCRVTSPKAFDADATESADIADAIRGLTADAVAAVIPSEGDSAALLKAYGLDTPYAQIVAAYPDTAVRLCASTPDSEGNVYLVNLSDTTTGGRIVYQIQYGALSWTSTSLEALTPTE